MKNVNYLVLLEKIMADNDYNQAKLGKELGVSKQYISQLFNGGRNIGKAMIAKINARFPDYVEDISSDVIDAMYLKTLRSKFKYSQAEFAEILGISQSLYAKLEANQRTITDKLQEKLISFELKGSAELAPKPNIVALKYCPNIQFPSNCNLHQKNFEHLYIDEKLLCADKNININPNKCFILSMIGSSLAPVYSDGDKIILDTSHKALKNDYTFAFKIKGQCYIRKINILPDKVKCISINNDQDTFYLNDANDVEVLGLVVPRIRF